MKVPVLSVCIPTFNRQNDLKECLEYLKTYWVPDVEIVVSDNASTDDTIVMLEGYAKELPLRWQCQTHNIGFDKNCAAVVAMARGKYCWILGSDDCIVPSALTKVLRSILQNDPDIFHFGYIQADIKMQPLSRVAPPGCLSARGMDDVELGRYLSSLSNVSLIFAFISCFIFRRQRWVAQLDRLPQWLDSHYVHTYMLHSMLARGASILASDECLVMARGGNPNEWNTASGKLLGLDAVTLLRIHREIYHASLLLEALSRVFRRSYPVKTIVRIAADGGLPQLLACRTELTALGYSPYLIRTLQLLDRFHLMPILARLVTFRRNLLKSLG